MALGNPVVPEENIMAEGPSFESISGIAISEKSEFELDSGKPKTENRKLLLKICETEAVKILDGLEGPMHTKKYS
jgi:hypothetical protein